MSFFVYIIYSKEIGQYYVGHSSDLDNRIFRHTNSGSKSTKKANDWKLMHQEEFATKAEAFRREIEIKSKKSKRYIERLISSAG
jgi:putative endonuclease